VGVYRSSKEKRQDSLLSSAAPAPPDEDALINARQVHKDSWIDGWMSLSIINHDPQIDHHIMTFIYIYLYIRGKETGEQSRKYSG
jgi:hypothetical protein